MIWLVSTIAKQASSTIIEMGSKQLLLWNSVDYHSYQRPIATDAIQDLVCKGHARITSANASKLTSLLVARSGNLEVLCL